MDGALRPLAPGPLIRLGSAALEVELAAQAGGRIARIRRHGIDWLLGHDQVPAAIGWGCYPMLPWAGRIRRGHFRFDGHDRQLPPTLGAHAIHGVGFTLPWQVDAQSPTHAELSLALPEDRRWPFGGCARQHIEVSEHSLRLRLSVQAGTRAMPMPVLGWHPWFLKPDTLDFRPDAGLQRDAEGIATLPPVAVMDGPWDDCFLNRRPVRLQRQGQRLQLRSGCRHWVVFDEPERTTCVEPQTGPLDAFNLHPQLRLDAGASTSVWFILRWSASP